LKGQGQRRRPWNRKCSECAGELHNHKEATLVYSLLYAHIPAPMLEHGGGSRPALPKEAFQEHRKTGRLPAHFVPQNWAFHAQCKMPDLLCLGARCLFAVSSRLRTVLESYAPNDIEYIPMRIHIPPNMEPADAYSCINILRLDRRLDWTRTPVGTGTYRGKLAKSANRSTMQGGYIFTAPEPGSPEIWREEGIETEQLSYWTDPTLIWISDRLHDAIENKFPGQMMAYKQLEAWG
jgi:hypothetical protein